MTDPVQESLAVLRFCARYLFIMLCAIVSLSVQETRAQHLSWVKCADLPFAGISEIHVSPSGDLFVWNDSTLCCSTDDGTSWQARPVLGHRLWALAVDSVGAVYAAMGDSLYVSHTSGADWTARGPVVTHRRPIKIHRNGSIFWGAAGDLYRSTDGGVSFTVVFQGNYLTSEITTFSLSPWGYLYAAQVGKSGINGSIICSTDNGTSWSGIIAAYNNNFLTLTASHPGLVFAGTSFNADHGGALLSTDFGGSWVPLPIPWLQADCSAACIDRNGRLYVGTVYVTTHFIEGVFVSSDRGLTWSQENSGLPSTRIEHLVLSPRGYLFTCFRGTQYFPAKQGVYRTVALATEVSPVGAQMPEVSALGRNYPNPFNPTTRIRFQLATTSNTRVAVYDLLGREVAVLVDAVTSPGSYEVPWTAAGCASGVYICRMVAGKLVASHKMLLAK